MVRSSLHRSEFLSLELGIPSFLPTSASGDWRLNKLETCNRSGKSGKSFQLRVFRRKA